MTRTGKSKTGSFHASVRRKTPGELFHSSVSGWVSVSTGILCTISSILYSVPSGVGSSRNTSLFTRLPKCFLKHYLFVDRSQQLQKSQINFMWCALHTWLYWYCVKEHWRALYPGITQHAWLCGLSRLTYLITSTGKKLIKINESCKISCIWKINDISEKV